MDFYGVYTPDISRFMGICKGIFIFYIDLFTLAVIKPVLTVILEVS